MEAGRLISVAWNGAKLIGLASTVRSVEKAQ